MAEVGAWRSFYELEDWLTLEELIVLYEKSSERQFRQMRTMAAAMGAELDDPFEKEDQKQVIHGARDVAQLPFGLGYSNVG